MRVPVCILCNVLWICCNKIHLEIQCWFVLTCAEVSHEGLYQSWLSLQEFHQAFQTQVCHHLLLFVCSHWTLWESSLFGSETWPTNQDVGQLLVPDVACHLVMNNDCWCYFWNSDLQKKKKKNEIKQLLLVHQLSVCTCILYLDMHEHDQVMSSILMILVKGQTKQPSSPSSSLVKGQLSNCSWFKWKILRFKFWIYNFNLFFLFFFHLCLRCVNLNVMT